MLARVLTGAAYPASPQPPATRIRSCDDAWVAMYLRGCRRRRHASREHRRAWHGVPDRVGGPLALPAQIEAHECDRRHNHPLRLGVGRALAVVTARGVLA